MSHEETKNFYNQAAQNSKKFGGYEYNRWFRDKVSKQIYGMTAREVEQISATVKFENYLEMGCGPAVWTKFFIKNHLGKNFDLVDISTDMIEQAKVALLEYQQVHYFVSDFLNFIPDKKYDFFFSGRAFEYLEDKILAVKKINDLLLPGGVGFIITKTPKYIRAKLLRRKVNFLHRYQINFSEFKKILEGEGFVEVRFFPATAYLPLLKSTFLNKLLEKLIKGFRLNWFTSLFTESYCVTFKKKN